MVLIKVDRLFFIFLLPCINIYGQHSITCDAGTSYVGEASNVTCNFYKDIKAKKTAISVVMVPTSNKKEQEERDVIQCSWAKLATKPECLVSEGYTFNYEVTDRLTVEIPSTTANFAGVYSCHIVPPNGATFETCELIVKVPEWLLGMLIVILILQIISILCVLVLCWTVHTIRRREKMISGPPQTERNVEEKRDNPEEEILHPCPNT